MGKMNISFFCTKISKATKDVIITARNDFDEVRTAPLSISTENKRLQRFFLGFWLPIVVMQMVFKNPATRRDYLRVTLTQVAITLVVGTFLAISGYNFTTFLAIDLNTPIQVVAFFSSLYLMVSIVEWSIIALSCQYHDRLERTAALMIGTEPNDPPAQPRIELDIPWIWKKAKQRVVIFWLLIWGIPSIALLMLIPTIGDALYSSIFLCWTFYWFAVFTTAKTAAAWRSKGDPEAPDPWFLRGWSFITNTIPGMRWWLPRLYVNIWRQETQRVFPPAHEFERLPYELAGLAALRVITSLPCLYIFFRPVFSVAATYLVLTCNSQTESPEKKLVGVDAP